MLVLTATRFEARALARGLDLRPAADGWLFERAGLRVAAVGLRAAALAGRRARLLPAGRAPLVISAGLCGGLDPALRRGDLVVPEAVLDPEGRARGTSPPERERLLAAARGSVAAGRVHGGRLVQAPEVVGDPAARAALWARTGAVAVDMESASILSAAAEAGCAAVVLRGVSDAAGDRLPPLALAAVDAEGRLRPGRAAAALARPASWFGLAALWRASRLALEAVAGTLGALVASAPGLAEE